MGCLSSKDKGNVILVQQGKSNKVSVDFNNDSSVDEEVDNNAAAAGNS